MLKYLIVSLFLTGCASTKDFIVRCNLNGFPVSGVFQGTVNSHLNYYDFETTTGLDFKVPVSACVVTAKNLK